MALGSGDLLADLLQLRDPFVQKRSRGRQGLLGLGECVRFLSSRDRAAFTAFSASARRSDAGLASSSAARSVEIRRPIYSLSTYVFVACPSVLRFLSSCFFAVTSPAVRFVFSAPVAGVAACPAGALAFARATDEPASAPAGAPLSAASARVIVSLTELLRPSISSHVGG